MTIKAPSPMFFIIMAVGILLILTFISTLSIKQGVEIKQQVGILSDYVMNPVIIAEEEVATVAAEPEPTPVVKSVKKPIEVKAGE